jgi:hypothetical protein
MKFYPYPNLNTINFRPILLLARVTAVFGYLQFILAIACLCAYPFLQSEQVTSNGLTFNTPDYSSVALIIGLWTIFGAFLSLGFSGVLALLVSIDSKIDSSTKKA